MILFYILFLFSYASDDDDCAFDLTHRESTGLKNRLGDLFQPKVESTQIISIPITPAHTPAPPLQEITPSVLVQHRDIFSEIKAGSAFSFTATCKGQKDTYRQWTDNPIQYTIDRTLPVPDEMFSFNISLEGQNIIISGNDLRATINADRGSFYLDGSGAYIGKNGYLSNTGEITFSFMTHRGWAGGEYQQIKWTCKYQIP
jgi:hypothetical protein